MKRLRIIINKPLGNMNYEATNQGFGNKQL